MQLIQQFGPLIFALSSVLFLSVLYWDERVQRVALEKRCKNVLDADAEATRVISVLTAKEQRIESQIHAANRQLSELDSQYSEKKKIFDKLLSEISIFDERLAFYEIGVYEPHFNFDDSEKFKSAIEAVRAERKALIVANKAVVCSTKWTVEGSRRKGEVMTARNTKLTLRAFNNECEAAIANTRWSNAKAMEKRIVKASEQLNKLNEPNQITVTKKYVDLQLRELRLTHEYREQLRAEREEKAEVARLAREEQKLQRDMEQALKDEQHYARLLDQARDEAARISGPRLEALEDQIRALERDLSEATANAVRALAMAEQTSSGYVYIISNIGSFGVDVVKIGLTRRLDPMERIKELGDASVPFSFDTHAIIYSDNAPALERALHAEFEGERINSQNFRKEFFRVSLPKVEDAVRRLAPTASFFNNIEAQEFRETVAKRNAQLAYQSDRQRNTFPIAV